MYKHILGLNSECVGQQNITWSKYKRNKIVL